MGAEKRAARGLHDALYGSVAIQTGLPGAIIDAQAFGKKVIFARRAAVIIQAV